MFVLMNLVLFFFLISFIIVSIGNLASKKNKFYVNNTSPFECGINSTQYFSSPLSLRFFILAVIFLIFDVELILLFPITVANLKFYSLISVFYFVFLLLIVSWGLLWEWNQMLLTWST